MGELDDCIKRGLIRKREPSRETALKGMAKAEKLLDEAKISLKANAPDSSLLMSYESILLTAKALLINDGFRERSHYCVVIYMKEIYADNGKIDKKIIGLFDHYRTLREMVAYDTDFTISNKDAEEAIKDADMIVKELRKLIK